MKSRLDELSIKYTTDKGSICHNYCEFYERHITTLTGTLLEIGIQSGASLRMWKEFFPQANIIGIDNNPASIFEDLSCILGDATQPETANKFEELSLDVVIDDGSHTSDDIVKTLHLFWPKVKSGGWYIIEDLGTQFFEEWGGSPAGSLALDAIYSLLKDALKENDSIAEFHAYKEIVFIKKA